MKTLLAIGLAAAVLAPASYAVGQARDPRVPGLQRKVAALQGRVVALEGDVSQFKANYVNQNIDHKTYQLLGCRSDGQPVSYE